MKTNLLALTATILCFSVSCAYGQTDPSTALIPKPVEQVFTDGYFTLDGSTRVMAGPSTDPQLEMWLCGMIGSAYPTSSSKKGGTIELITETSNEIPEEGYILTVEPQKIRISSSDRAGMFYGIQTLLQLMPTEIYSGRPLGEAAQIRAQRISDYPQYKYRGMHLDVARTFSDKERVLRYIDNMARHKLNTLHWHLTDDEGWRIELKCYPELATIGGFRGGDSPVEPIYGEWDKKYGGYFTQDEIREVVGYANLRNIDVIPEIDLPGHSRTAARVFPRILCGTSEDAKPRPGDRRDVWCVAKEANYQMLDEIITEVMGLFTSDYFHVGGDEVSTSQWEKCPDCQRIMKQRGYSKTRQLEDYFMDRVVSIVERNGKKACVWDEASERGELSKNSQVYAWQGIKSAKESTSKGYQTVVMPGSYFYFDMKQSPYEDGLTWAGLVPAKRAYSFELSSTGFTPEQMKKVRGVEGAFWAELYLSHTPEYLDYMTYPRICALSEVAWCDEKTREWDDFYTRLTGAHLDRLTAMGIGYRLFPPLTDYKSGVITAAAPFEGVEIRYTNDGSEPNSGSPLYEGPISDEVPERYLFRGFYRGVESPSVIPSGKHVAAIPGSKTTTVEIPLSKLLNTNGTWLLTINTPDDNLRLEKLAITHGGATTNIASGQRVTPLQRLRIRATDNNRNGTMLVTIKNGNEFPCELSFEFERSPYIEPAVKLTSSMGEQERFPLKYAEDYNNGTYTRTSRPCRKGDDLTFTFVNPVDAYSIEVHTGLSYLPRYHIPSGRVQVSADGSRFTDVATLTAGKATIFPEGKVKAIRIVSDSDGNSENAVAVQDLKIKPRR